MASASLLHGQATITITPQAILTDAKHLGINLSGQSFYDSGQMLRNLTFRNPGFEGEQWQSILHCKWVAGDQCTDDNRYAVWPADFLKGARYDVMTGPRQGASGVVHASSAAAGDRGVTLTLDAPAIEDAYVLVRADKPGDPTAGWWTSADGGAAFSAEFHDLAPNTQGKQALRIMAAGAGHATVSSYFDSLAGHSFVQLRGAYTLSFRAKGVAVGSSLDVKLERLDQKHGLHQFFTRSIALTPAWHDYSFRFEAHEDGSAIGTVGLTFDVRNASLLLDDVALTAPAGPGNPTAFRDKVVETLRALHPGVLRYMDNGGDFGASLENMLAPVFGRRRAGSSTQSVRQEDIPLGLVEFLTLAQAVGAEPWYAMPPGTTPEEARALIEYLAAPVSTPYGGLRAKLGHAAPWTSVFPVIHLELGNEEWNSRSFAGSAMPDPKAYAQRASAVFAATRAASAYKAQSFDLILGSWATVPWWTGAEQAAAHGEDSIALAPYLFDEFNDAASDERVFGPMFAAAGAGGLAARRQHAAAACGPQKARGWPYMKSIWARCPARPRSLSWMPWCLRWVQASRSSTTCC